MTASLIVVASALALIAPAQTDAPVEATDDASAAAEATLFPVPDYTGDFGSRAKLTGDWGGSRSELAAKGIQFELDFTQTYQGVVDGGRDTGFEYTGALDYVLKLDFDKMGLWPGAFVLMRGETLFGDSINRQTGALIAANSDALFPVPGEDVTTLTDLVFTQFLSESFAVMLGKISTLDGDMNDFAHGRGTDQFMNLAFVANPVTLRTVPYAALGGGVVWLPNEKTQIALLALDAEGAADTSGFDTVFEAGTVFSGEMRIATNFFDKPGHQLFGFTWSDREFVSLQQDRRIILNLLPGITVPLSREDDSWSLYYNFDQYLWMLDAEAGTGVGLFGRLGYADEDTNPIEWFASLGLGGRGLCSSRPNDTFGVGMYYAAASDQIPAIFNADDGYGFEAFYNFEVTPWLHVTPDIQIIEPGATDVDTAIVAGIRVKAEF